MQPLLSSQSATTSALTCRNCGHSGAGRFCQECGQSYATHRISLHQLAHEVFHLFTHLEKGFLYTLRELIRRPGDMQGEYLEGKRYRYQKPISLFFVVVSVTALGQFLIKSAITKLHGVTDDSQDYFRHYFALMQMVLLPVYALIMWLFFRRGRYNYAEVAVTVLYSLSLIILVTLLLNVVRLIFPHFDTKYAELPFIIVYNTWTYFRLFPEQPRWLLISKSLLINSLCFALSHVAAELVIHFAQH